MAIAEILPPERKKGASLSGVRITREDRLLPAKASETSNGLEASKPANEHGLAVAVAKIISVQRARQVPPKQTTVLARQVTPSKETALALNNALDGVVNPPKPHGLMVANKETGLVINAKKEPLKTASELMKETTGKVGEPNAPQQRPQGNTSNHQHDFSHPMEDIHNFATKHLDHAHRGAQTHFSNVQTAGVNIFNTVLDAAERSKYRKDSANWKAQQQADALAREDARDKRNIEEMKAMFQGLMGMGAAGGQASSRTQSAGYVS